MIRIGDYEFLSTQENLLGKGSYGQVYRCNKINTNEVYCIKVVRKDIIQETLINSIKREISILKQIKEGHCENLVNFYDVYDQADFLYIIMEICDYDLSYEFDMLKKQNTWYTENEQIDIIQQIVQGFKGLFEMNVIHRDIKPQNILIKKINENPLQTRKIYKVSIPSIQITDFGFSRFLDDLTKKGNFTRVGTPAYVAPQLYFDTQFSGKCDIFSYGVVFYQLTHQAINPAASKSVLQIKEYLIKLKTTPLQCKIEVGNHIQELSNLIERMLIYSEEDRINFNEIFTHPIMKINQTGDSLFTRIFKQPDQQYLIQKSESAQNEKIASRLERINTILTVFYRKFLFIENCVKQMHNDQNIYVNMTIFYLFQLGLNQLTYAMAMIHVNLSDIHECFKNDNDILHLIEILQQCKIAVQNNFEKNRLRRIISNKYFEWKGRMIRFSGVFQGQLLQKPNNQIAQQYNDYLTKSFIKRVNEQKIYESLSKLIDEHLTLQQYYSQNFRSLQMDLRRTTQLEELFPIERYLSINLDEIFSSQSEPIY